MTKTGIKVFSVILVLSITGGGFFVGWLFGNDWQFSSNPKQITPEIDGIIEKSEWLRSSYYNIPFYLDINNTIDLVENKANVDGWNYLSVGEDEEYYYIALDLCSDRTNNKEGEWIGFHLANILPDAFSSKLAFSALEDYGFEYFHYNVSGDSVFDDEYTYYPGSANYYDIPIVPGLDYFEVLRGDVDGDLDDLWRHDDAKAMKITSKYYEAVPLVWMEGQFFAVHFGVNITEKFPDEAITPLWSSLSDMDISLTLTSNLTSSPSTHYGNASEFFCAIAEHGGVPGNVSSTTFLSDPNELYFVPDENYYLSADLDHNSINATNGMFYFSVYGWNDEDAFDSTAFEIEIDKISLKLTTENMQTVLGTSLEPTNYAIAYSYGSSDNCEEDHRMFEFKVAKSEFPVLEDDFFYISVSGYGTMALEYTNYWVYPQYAYPSPAIYAYANNREHFLALDMSIT